MTNKIQVFAAEKEAGLEHAIHANATIAYHTPVLLKDQPLEIRSRFKPLPFTKAAKDDDDIYHVYSILVTTSWNKNDDVFDKAEVWGSKDTPKYKPTNLEHDEKQIVGGIIDNWAVDENFDLIDEKLDTNELPDHYHILVPSVIYKQWQDPAYQTRALDLIRQIEAGDKHVSMECIFRGFDYAIVGPDGSHHIVARNDETAFLTQHLRSYGGNGQYQDHQVGRLLRNITFSGKGFVDRPANPESIIFDQNRVFEFNKASISSKNMFFDKNGVIMKIDNLNSSDTQESYDMSNEILTDQVAELKEALESARSENKVLADQLSEANVEKHQKTIEKLTEKLSASEEQIQALTTDLEAAKSASDELTSKLEDKTEAHDKLEAEIAQMAAAEKARARKAALIEAGLSEEEAEAKMETFGDLTDEQFTSLAETLSTYTKVADTPDTLPTQDAEDTGEAKHEDDKNNHKKRKDEEDEDSDASEVAEEKTDEEVLETVQAEESPAMSVESDASVGDDETDTTRSSLQDWVQTVILNNNSESGE